MRFGKDGFRSLFRIRQSETRYAPADVTRLSSQFDNSERSNGPVWSNYTSKLESSLTNEYFDDGQQMSNIGPQPGDTIRLRLLVLAAENSDPNLKAISTIMDYIGVPYDTFITESSTLTEARLWRGSYCQYQGLILTANRLQHWNRSVVEHESTFSSEEWRILRRFRSRFGIRQVSLFSTPGEYGDESRVRLSEYVDTNTEPIDVHLTDSGSKIFWYLNPATPIPVRSVPAYLAEPLTDTAVPLLVTADERSMAILNRHDNGIEDLMLTMSHGADLLHSMLLGYGIINWVAQGLFLGERNVCLSVQVDDIFNCALLWDPDTTKTNEDREIFRLDKRDIVAVKDWLRKVRQETVVAPSFTLDFAFNGGGVSPEPEDDPLVRTLVKYQDHFRWINHGFSHLHLDSADEDASRYEIVENQKTAEELGLTHYTTACMVTSETSGLKNNSFLDTAQSLGVRYVVSDTSQPEWNNPQPNTGIPCPQCPQILAIPRHPNNLLHDVSTPLEWESRYNEIYRDYWGRDLDVDEIIEQEATTTLKYLLSFDTDPLMFHQADLRAYDGIHSLLTDLLDRVIDKYMTFYRDVPIISLSMQEIGQRMERRAEYDAAHILACIVVGDGLLLSAQHDVVVPITGVIEPDDYEDQGCQSQTMISLKQGEATRIPSHLFKAHVGVYQT